MGSVVFYLAIAMALLILGRHIKHYVAVSHLQAENFESFKGDEDVIYESSDEIRMNILSVVAVSLGIAMLWLKDSTPLQLTRVVAVILIAKGFGSLLQASQTYRLHYNDQRVLYLGHVIDVDEIKSVRRSGFFLKPGHIVFKNGQTMPVFNKGIESLKKRFQLLEL